MKWVLFFWVCTSFGYDEVGDLVCQTRESFPPIAFDTVEECSARLDEVTDMYLGSGKVFVAYCTPKESPLSAGD